MHVLGGEPWTRTGCPTDWHLMHLASRASGGAGLVMGEATAVRSDGRMAPWDLGLWNAGQEKVFCRIARGIREQGAVGATSFWPGLPRRRWAMNPPGPASTLRRQTALRVFLRTVQ